MIIAEVVNVKQVITAGLMLVMALTSLTACGGGGNDDNLATPSTNTVEMDEKKIYKIADYYQDDGNFSLLGQELPWDPTTAEKALDVALGDILIVGDKQYQVTAESLTLHFYTQPSLAEVLAWWSDEMETGQDRNQLLEVR